VLRCEGCAVLHHPGCWVTNGGCATETEHRVAPAAMAYSSSDRSIGVPNGSPGEGTRLTPPPTEVAAPEPIPFRAAARPLEAAVPDDGPVIGAPPTAAPVIHRTLPSTVGIPASPPRRYQPPPGEHMPRKTMPQIYDRHRIFGYWYVPAAILLAIFVAFSVIWIAGKLTGGDSDNADDSSPTAGAGGALTPVPGSPTSSASPAGSQSPAPSTGAGKFKGGDTVVVTGTGDCLNVRVKAGRENDAIVCVKDGTELAVTGGPESASDLTWWKVRTELGEGWAAEDYLAKKP
jgi:hypothetical protein